MVVRWMGQVLRVAVAAATVAVVASAGAQPAVSATPIPVEVFFSPAKMQGAKLSPSGRWLAAVTSVPGKRVGLLITDLEGKEGSQFLQASDKEDVAWVEWVSEDWLVFTMHDPDDQSVEGRRSAYSGLLTVKRDGTGSRLLIARDYGRIDPIVRRRYLTPDHRYIGLGAPGTNEVLLVQSQWDVNGQPSHTSPKALNVATGDLRSLDAGAPRASGWWFDGQGRPRVASQDSGGDTTFWWNDLAGGAWRELGKWPRFKLPFVPMYVEGDNTLVVEVDNSAGDLELRRFDFATGKPEGTSLVTTPGFDGGVGVARAPGSGEVLGLRLEVDAETAVWFSPAMKELQAKVDAKFPGYTTFLQCRPCDKPRVVLVYAYSDTDPGSYVLYRPQQDKWQLVGQKRPDIDPQRMAALEFHRTKARDGEDLPVWVTRPAQAASAPARPAPAVMLVHGGPNLRGTHWEWSGEAQFLASRGYVVIEPEFRGSRGYGEKHFRAGFKQWGRSMQDDVTDALRFAVAQGWVDASRVCIMGGSYGGYAALMGLVKDPDQYRCGVAFAAVADPRFMFDFHWNDISEAGKQYSLAVTVGDPKTDAAMLAAVSPLELAERIKAPVLLVHGGIDRRVPIQNGERMRDALKKNGKDVDWVVYGEEGHGFTFLANELDYYRRVEAFLAKNLK